jgi:hypothetical protein
VSTRHATFTVTDPHALDLIADRIAMAVGREVANLAAQFTPVGDTGDLHAGWRVEPQWTGTVRVVNDTPYAKYVEFGVRGHQGAAMLGRATAAGRAAYGRP